MDSKKICFIMCTNNEFSKNEALYYINRLSIPDGYALDCITVTDAHSMTSGYNEAMQASDAKYKIYMHQDVFIVDKNFLYKLLDIFSDKKIGMIGIIGAQKMPVNGIMWEGNEVGAFFSTCIYTSNRNISPSQGQKYFDVEAADGMLLATQYDIPWREDLFDGWDFYDASQSFEFRKRGYKVVVPVSDNALVVHNDGLLNLRNYFKYRKIFIKEYSNLLN